MKNNANQQPTIKGWWKFDESTSNVASDCSNNGHTLIPTGNPVHTRETNLSGAMAFDGATQWLGSNKTVLRTDESYSIVAWVRLDSVAMNGKMVLKAGEHALTAVSQDTPTHSAFYLGARHIEATQPDGTTTSSLKWNFTVSPIDGSETGALEWLHAHAPTTLNESVLDKWIMLVGVCDIPKRTVHIYVPSTNESGKIHMPDEWIFWRAEGGLQVGRGLWLGRNVDHWPGRVGPVRAYSGVLGMEDAKRLYAEDSKMMESV